MVMALSRLLLLVQYGLGMLLRSKSAVMIGNSTMDIIALFPNSTLPCAQGQMSSTLRPH